MLMKPSMCSVFAESEVISLIANNKEKADIVRAVEEKIGSKLYICEEPEIVGAAGAAIYALEKAEE